MCGGLTLQQRQFNQCDTMEFESYEKLIEKEIKLLQTKVTVAIDKGINSIEKKQSELIAKIKADPRKSAIESMTLELELKTSGLFYYSDTFISSDIVHLRSNRSRVGSEPEIMN